MHTVSGSFWQESLVSPADVQELQRALGISPVVARVLANRGIADPEQAHLFLSGTLADLCPPQQMAGMRVASQALELAITGQHPIRIYGDYDVDGVTGTALLVRALRALGGQVDYYIPHRVHEGYGLNRAALERAASEGIKLLVTVDCGIGGAAEVARAHRLGMEAIVTDHHHPPAELPAALAVLNPRMEGCPYPFKELAGVGIAWKLVCALAERMGAPPGSANRFLDLVALGTIADVAPLCGENRLMVKEGLRLISRSRKLGLATLVRLSGIKGPVGSRQVAFGLAPRLNAGGRLEHAQSALELLLTDSPAQAAEMADHLCRLNEQRQQEQKRILDQACRMANQADLGQERALVLASPDWHPGVIGIVASRLVEAYRRPTFLIALDDGVGKGSARSIPGFHLCQALEACSQHLEHFGGHQHAAGFSLRSESLEDFRAAMLQVAAERISPEDLRGRLPVDAFLPADQVTPELVSELDELSPFGAGNPPPLFASLGLRILEVSQVGQAGQHLRLSAADPATGCAHACIWFGRGSLAESLSPGQQVDLCYHPRLEDWDGGRSVKLVIEDMALGRRVTTNGNRGSGDGQLSQNDRI